MPSTPITQGMPRARSSTAQWPRPLPASVTTPVTEAFSMVEMSEGNSSRAKSTSPLSSSVWACCSAWVPV